MKTSIIKKRYGLIPSNNTPKNVYGICFLRNSLPIEHYLKPMKVYDQGILASCVSNSVISLLDYKTENLSLSRLFLYYNARLLEGTELEDIGTTIDASIESIKDFGVCKEPYHSYSIGYNIRPLGIAYDNALNHTFPNFKKIRISIEIFKNTLLDNKPIAFGFVVQEHFETLTGVYKHIKNSKEVGNHCVVTVGYSDEKNAFLVQNSWGDKWNQNGYFWMSYDYISSGLCMDAYIISN